MNRHLAVVLWFVFYAFGIRVGMGLPSSYRWPQDLLLPACMIVFAIGMDLHIRAVARRSRERDDSRVSPTTTTERHQP